MSSGTSISADVRVQPPRSDDGAQDDAPRSDRGLQPWQLFVLAGLACATVAMFLTRAQGVSGVILLSLLIGTAAVVGLASLLALRPLVTDRAEGTRVIGQRTRGALEREKTLALRALKELEFDRAMGKLSDSDFHEMSTRLRARAARLIRQLDVNDDYRGRIEQDLAVRLGQSGDVPQGAGTAPAAATAARTCAACATTNDADARFCMECGAKL